MTKPSCDVAIIGGGLSGLAAAVDLAGAGARICLFEQGPRLGGRCYSFQDRTTGDVVDNGQHVLLGAYHHLFDYLSRIGTQNLVRREAALSLPVIDSGRGRGVFRIGRLPRPFDVASGMLSYSLLPFGDRWKLLKVGLSLGQWNTALEDRLRSLSVEAWLESLGQSQAAKECLWYPLAVSIMNESPEDACALPFARSLRMAFSGERADSAILIPTVGQSEIYVTPAEAFLRDHGAEVLPGTGIQQVIVAGGKATGVQTVSGDVHYSGQVISTVPFHALLPMIPPVHRDGFAYVTKFDSSPIVSLNLWFDREFMEEDFIGIVNRDLQWLFNRRKILGEGKGKGSYLTGVISAARRHADLTSDELVARAVSNLHEVFPASGSALLTSSLVIKEKRATFAATCAAEVARPGPETVVGNFYLAGDWTNTGLPATIEGAVLSGFRAAEACAR